MPDRVDREDEEMSASAYEAETELRGERAREGLEHLDAGGEDDASGLAQSPFNRLAEAYRLAAAREARTEREAAVHYHFGRQYFQVALYEQAVEALRRAVELTPTLAEAHYYLASSLREQGKINEALASYKRALELDDKLFEARLEQELTRREGGNGEKS